jgi:predicted RecB family nuclease
MRDVCYLHGFLARRHGKIETEQFVYFFADAPTQFEERKAFADAIAYMRDAHDAVIYYYSKYERTIYRKLQNKYPDVCTAEEIEAIFDPLKSIDLYFDLVLKATEWPTRDYSIRSIAKYLGFSWRDIHPSGAASIAWFHSYTESGDPAIKQRILDYNEDDCRATRVLLDGIRAL